jgi:hypothetical protein
MQQNWLLLIEFAKFRDQCQLVEPTKYMKRLTATKIPTSRIPGRYLFLANESAQSERSLNESGDNGITGTFNVGILFARKLWR